jgi:hypothetical protein
MKTARIDVSTAIARIVVSRDTIDILKALILKARSKSVDLDFKDVEFLSRSAAHELLTLKDELSHSFLRKKIVSFINPRDNVSEMLKIVASSRAVPKPRAQEYRIERGDTNFLYNLPSA